MQHLQEIKNFKIVSLLVSFYFLNLFNHGKFAFFDDVMCNKFKFFENLLSCYTYFGKIELKKNSTIATNVHVSLKFWFCYLGLICVPLILSWACIKFVFLILSCGAIDGCWCLTLLKSIVKNLVFSWALVVSMILLKFRKILCKNCVKLDLWFGYLCKFVNWISCVSIVHCTWKPSLKNILQKWKHIQLRPWIKKDDI